MNKLVPARWGLEQVIETSKLPTQGEVPRLPLFFDHVNSTEGLPNLKPSTSLE